LTDSVHYAPSLHSTVAATCGLVFLGKSGATERTRCRGCARSACICAHYVQATYAQSQKHVFHEAGSVRDISTQVEKPVGDGGAPLSHDLSHVASTDPRARGNTIRLPMDNLILRIIARITARMIPVYHHRLTPFETFPLIMARTASIFGASVTGRMRSLPALDLRAHLSLCLHLHSLFYRGS
jgi:hypothetical protein